MRKQINTPAAAAVVAVIVVIVIAVGWYMTNRDLKPIAYTRTNAATSAMPAAGGPGGAPGQPRLMPGRLGPNLQQSSRSSANN